MIFFLFIFFPGFTACTAGCCYWPVAYSCMELMGVEVESFYTLTCRSRRLQAVKIPLPGRRRPLVSPPPYGYLLPTRSMLQAVAARGLPCRHAATDCSPCSFFFSTGQGRSFCNKTPSEISCACSISSISSGAQSMQCGQGHATKRHTHRPEGGISGWAGLGKVRAWPAGRLALAAGGARR